MTRRKLLRLVEIAELRGVTSSVPTNYASEPTFRRRSIVGLGAICGRPQTFDGGREPTQAARRGAVRALSRSYQRLGRWAALLLSGDILARWSTTPSVVLTRARSHEHLAATVAQVSGLASSGSRVQAREGGCSGRRERDAFGGSARAAERPGPRGAEALSTSSASYSDGRPLFPTPRRP